MLNIAFEKLPGCRSQDMSARQLRSGMHESQRVLKLIPKPERPAGLKHRRPRPEAAAQRLVWEPAIQHEIGG
jgi:hypothetical protein